MKITIESITKREIEITFPFSFKVNSSTFFHCFDENDAIAIYTGIRNIDMTTTYAVINQYKEGMKCSKSEVENAFNLVRSYIQGRLFLIDTPEIPTYPAMDDNNLVPELEAKHL